MKKRTSKYLSALMAAIMLIAAMVVLLLVIGIHQNIEYKQTSTTVGELE